MKQQEKIKFNDLPLEQYFSRQTAKITGNIILLRSFRKEFAVGQRQYKSLKKEDSDDDQYPAEKLTPDQIRDLTLRRAKSRLIDLVNTNVFAYKKSDGEVFPPVFLTLTMDIKKVGVEIATDIQTANYEFTKFIQRLNLRIINQKKSYSKYVAVIEFQKDIDFKGIVKANGGAIHYHIILFNMPFIHKTEIEKIWGNGFIRVREIEDVTNVGFYITKYMIKDLNDPRLKNHKCYITSKMLLKPTIVQFEELINLIKLMLPQECLEKKVLDIPIKYLSAMSYWRYNLRLRPEVKDEINKFVANYL